MPKLLVEDSVTVALLPRFEAAAQMLVKALENQRPILVRFDGDGDGISSALSIVEALESAAVQHHYPLKLLRTVQSEGPNYRDEEATLDVGNVVPFADNKPLMVFLDHGGNDTSLPALAKLKENDFQLIVVDHHPTNVSAIEQVVDVFACPWAVCDNGSDYPTALLAYEIACRVWPGQAEKTEYAYWGLQADKSPFASKGTLKEPLVIEYLVKYNQDASSLPSYRRALAHPQEVERIYHLAKEKMDQAKTKAIAKAKVKPLKDLTLIVAKLNVLGGKWPPKGQLVNRLQAHYSETLAGGVVVIGYGDDKILFRANQKAFDMGFRANTFITALKEQMPQSVYSGGGHEVAAAMKVNREHLKPLLEQLVTMIQTRFG